MLLRTTGDKPGTIDLLATSKQNESITNASSARVLSKGVTSKEAFEDMDLTVSSMVQEAICTISFTNEKAIANFVLVVPLQVAKEDLSDRS